MNHLLQINDKQARLIAEALELMMRINMGQLNYIYEHLFLHRRHPGTHKDIGVTDDSQDIVTKLRELKMMMFALDAPNSYFGIGSDKLPDDVRVVYDLYKVLTCGIVGSDKFRVLYGPDPQARIQLVGSAFEDHNLLEHQWQQRSDKPEPSAKTKGKGTPKRKSTRPKKKSVK